MKIKPSLKKEYAKYLKESAEDRITKGITVYAERWAELMERKLSEGQTLEAVAKQTSHDADENGITGFMFGCAIELLSHFWLHGEQLRRWHGETYGFSNPAILRIS